MADNTLPIFIVYRKDGEIVNPGDQYPNEFSLVVGAPERSGLEFDEWLKASVQAVLSSYGLDENEYEIGWDTINPYPPRNT